MGQVDDVGEGQVDGPGQQPAGPRRQGRPEHSPRGRKPREHGQRHQLGGQVSGQDVGREQRQRRHDDGDLQGSALHGRARTAAESMNGQGGNSGGDQERQQAHRQVDARQGAAHEALGVRQPGQGPDRGHVLGRPGAATGGGKHPKQVLGQQAWLRDQPERQPGEETRQCQNPAPAPRRQQQERGGQQLDRGRQPEQQAGRQTAAAPHPRRQAGGGTEHDQQVELPLVNQGEQWRIADHPEREQHLQLPVGAPRPAQQRKEQAGDQQLGGHHRHQVDPGDLDADGRPEEPGDQWRVERPRARQL